MMVATVRNFYEAHGRHMLPWRKTSDPYCIVVSEIMLQQTQVERVIQKYSAFLKQWPTVEALAQASLGDVLRAWQGLGYNRRAKMLHECAKTVVLEYGGVFPDTLVGLKALPGIGPYTAGAVLAFAFNRPQPIIETNIRTVYLYHFFKNAEEVSETAILNLVEKTLDTKNPRDWYWALMDYGVHLKKEHGNLNTKATSYSRQSTFKGSDREIRGVIIRTLATQAHTKTQLVKELAEFPESRIESQLKKLITECLVVNQDQKYQLP